MKLFLLLDKETNKQVAVYRVFLVKICKISEGFRMGFALPPPPPPFLVSLKIVTTKLLPT